MKIYIHTLTNTKQSIYTGSVHFGLDRGRFRIHSVCASTIDELNELKKQHKYCIKLPFPLFARNTKSIKLYEK